MLPQGVCVAVHHFQQLNAVLREFTPVKETGSGPGRVDEAYAMETAALGLTFEVMDHHISGLNLECASSIGSVYWQSFQVWVNINEESLYDIFFLAFLGLGKNSSGSQGTSHCVR